MTCPSATKHRRSSSRTSRARISCGTPARQATSIGNPSVFGHGMLTAGLMARVLKDWFGPAALRRFQVRFSKQVWPGETLTCTATVTGVRDAEESDVGLVDVECQVVNQDGEA